MKPSLPLFLIGAGLACSAIAADPATGVTSNPAQAGNGVQVGVATRDGITISGGEAFVTRNGSTEKLTKELVLPSGVKVEPDGTFTTRKGKPATLRATQLLTLDGKIKELPPNPNVNPGDPRGNGTASREVVPDGAGGTVPVGTNPTGTATGSRLTRNQGGGTESVFLNGDGVPFMATINGNGTLTRTDGTILPFDAAFRPITFGLGGTPSLGTLNANGTITRSDGATMALDGSVRAADGTLISPPANANAGASTNANTATNGNNTATTNTQQGAGGTQQGTATQQGAGGTQQIDPATGQPINNGAATNNAGSSRNTNSPNNSGTVNRSNATPNAAGSANNTGTVNNTNNGANGGVTNGSAGTGTTNGTNGGTSNARSGGGANSGGGAKSGGGGNAGGAAGGGAGGGAKK